MIMVMLMLVIINTIMITSTSTIPTNVRYLMRFRLADHERG